MMRKGLTQNCVHQGCLGKTGNHRKFRAIKRKS
jgi:hypothetical protein